MADLVGIHGTLMIIAWLFLTEMSETIAWWAANKTNLKTNYFKAVEHGTKLFNAHRILNSLAFILALIALIIILSTEEFKEAWNVKVPERHVIYGMVMMLGAFLQILLKIAFTTPSMKVVHRWFGRSLNLWAFFVAFTGYELADNGTNDGTDSETGSGEDGMGLAVIFAIWYAIKLGIWVYYFVQRKRGKAKDYSVAAAEGIQIPNTLATPSTL